MIPTDLWSEEGDRLWLRADLADRPETAKRIAFLGRSRDRTVSLPIGFGTDGTWSYDDLTVKHIFARPGDPDEGGWAGSGEDTWWYCEWDHPKAVRFWEVSGGA